MKIVISLLFTVFFIITVNAQKNDYIVVFNTTPEISKKIKIKKSFKKVFKGFVLELTESEAITLRNNKNVKYIEKDSDAVLPDITWGLDRIDQRFLPLNYTYNYFHTGNGVDAYILDTGIYTKHADFGGRASIVLDVIKDGYEDCNSHGTHVAGTVGSTTYGVAKNVNLKALRVMGCGGGITVSNIIEAIDWVIINKTNPSIINISLVVSTVSNSLNYAVEQAVANDVVVVVAAANYNLDACNFSPGSAASALTVGATDYLDAKALYSNYGICIDVFAPGTGIMSLLNADSGTSIKSGTSMSAPHVTGIVALYLETNPNARALDVHNTIKYSATFNIVTGLDQTTPNALAFTMFNSGCSMDYYSNYLNNTTDYFTIRSTKTVMGTVSNGFNLVLEKKQGQKWVTVTQGNTIHANIKSGIYRWSITGNGIYTACLMD